MQENCGAPRKERYGTTPTDWTSLFYGASMTFSSRACATDFVRGRRAVTSTSWSTCSRSGESARSSASEPSLHLRGIGAEAAREGSHRCQRAPATAPRARGEAVESRDPGQPVRNAVHRRARPSAGPAAAAGFTAAPAALDRDSVGARHAVDGASAQGRQRLLERHLRTGSSGCGRRPERGPPA